MSLLLDLKRITNLQYANWRKLSPIVCGSTFIGWYFSFIIIFVLPLDVSIVSFHHVDQK